MWFLCEGNIKKGILPDCPCYIKFVNLVHRTEVVMAEASAFGYDSKLVGFHDPSWESLRNCTVVMFWTMAFGSFCLQFEWAG